MKTQRLKDHYAKKNNGRRRRERMDKRKKTVSDK
jgi:hypothetical protein